MGRRCSQRVLRKALSRAPARAPMAGRKSLQILPPGCCLALSAVPCSGHSQDPPTPGVLLPASSGTRAGPDWGHTCCGVTSPAPPRARLEGLTVPKAALFRKGHPSLRAGLELGRSASSLIRRFWIPRFHPLPPRSSLFNMYVF